MLVTRPVHFQSKVKSKRQPSEDLEVKLEPLTPKPVKPLATAESSDNQEKGGSGSSSPKKPVDPVAWINENFFSELDDNRCGQ